MMLIIASLFLDEITILTILYMVIKIVKVYIYRKQRDKK